MLDLIGNGRPAGDLLSRVVRITLGGIDYQLPVLTIGGNKKWRAQLNERLGALLTGLEESGADVPALLTAIGQQVDDLLDLLISYDKSSLLPERGVLEDTVYEDDLLAAVREVWRAANPLVGIGVEDLVTTDLTESVSSPPTSSRQRSTGGRPKGLRKH